MKNHGKIAASTPCFCHMAIDIFKLKNTSKLPMRLQSVIGKGAINGFLKRSGYPARAKNFLCDKGEPAAGSSDRRN
jgi:hypothetical protein